ncbi:hypothetical protein [Microbaculum marinum]|uniref:Uncharacterized protein n=1 Tax=Microbaculum marinum TaxID=1764581 RepID=A0AAW9RTQ4_9HYPH
MTTGASRGASRGAREAGGLLGLLVAALAGLGLLAAAAGPVLAQSSPGASEVAMMTPRSGPAIGGGEATAMSCPLRYKLPGDVRADLPSDSAQGAFDKYSWRTFLALNAQGVGKRISRRGDNQTQWSRWSSTDGLINCARDPDSPNCKCPDGDCFASGTEYYPDECMAIDGYQKYRVLAEVSKVDDLFLQAGHGELSNDPLIDANGNFLRFEIMVSPAAQRYVVDNELYDGDVVNGLTENVNFPCGREGYRRGDPASRKAGAYVVKNAWMELPDEALAFGYADRGRFHIEELLVHSPAYTNKSGVATCEKKVMALVGQHIAHKTVKQPRWTWSTFEHNRNAPNCTELPPTGDQQDAGPSTACPANVKRTYNFFPKECSANGADPDACQSCNVVPVSNRPGCKNPDVDGDTSWCLDRSPKPVAGMTRACTQVNVRKYYPTAHEMNKACEAALGSLSVWSNYKLISTQWYNTNSTSCTTETNVDRGLEQPQVPIAGRGNEETTPYLANSSMETYVRANCMGCHSNARIPGPPAQPTPSTVYMDFMYWLKLESADTGDSDGLAAMLERSPH